MLDLKTRSILFIVAHPYLEKSRANRAVVEAVSDVPGLTLRRLYDVYPFFHIDVNHEQELLQRHDLILIQHPLYWYSMPALMKLWVDEVLQCGWAYGPEGDKLRGKDFLLSITAGGLREGYSAAGYNRFEISTLLTPWNQTAHLCGMRWHEPRVIHGSIQADGRALTAHANQIREGLLQYSETGTFP